MTTDDVSHLHTEGNPTTFDQAMSEATSLIEELAGGDPADSAEPSSRLAALLSGLLEDEEERPGA